MFGIVQLMTALRDAQDTRPRRGRRPTLSLDAVLDAAVAILDEAGQGALTIRGLAARLDTGVGAIYHYVSGRDELLDRATNEILLNVISEKDLPDDPYEALRALSVSLYDVMQAHTWAGAYVMRDTTLQPNSLRLFELFGQQLMRIGLASEECFDAASSLVSFVMGTGAEMRELPASVVSEGKTQEEALREYADSWQQLDPEQFPFIHSIIDGFAQHDDREQFLTGVDIFLAGIRARAL